MGTIDSRCIAEIKSRLSLVDIVNRFVELRPVGDRWTAPCPFHQETKPSFSVSPDKGFYYCFGCQASGDLIEFYKNINGLDFAEAVRQLADEAGVVISVEDSRKNRKDQSEVTTAQEVNSLAGKFFLDQLWSSQGDEARKYLHSRGMTKKIVQDFRLGWSPDGWQSLGDFLREKGHSADDGVLAGVLSQNQKGRIYDRFRSRLIFPIISLSGMVVAFGGRILDHGEPKYLNSSESPVYKKGEHLYGLFQARKHITQTRKVLLTEGYLDVMALHQHGFANSCGVLGTALTPAQVKRLGGLAREAILLFDGDQAGRNAALRSAEMFLAAGMNCRVVLFPEGEDAHSLLFSQGAEALERLLSGADSGLNYCLKMVKDQKSPREVMAWVVSFLGKLEDFSLKTYYIPKLAGSLGLTEVELRKGLQGKGSIAGPAADSGDKKNQPEQRDKEILTFAVCCPEFRESLDQLNLDPVLRSDWARTFWSKIKHGSGRDEDLKLDHHESDFYVRARMEQDQIRENRLQIFKELEEFIIQKAGQVTKKNLKQALVRAQQNQDHNEVKRILSLMQNSL
ncbi:DNA primase [Desulfonatronovibrio hydrogenovorans]|uniref:DNA primase n=1 Tax=Desulfonatronovibrio hydrogenovorans TaxID=53245 RepID=UPI00054DCA75|nr:DNA primase [Desulfonatronovibrio hydrogenovorans]